MLVVNVVAFRNRRRKHLTPYFAGMKMANISPSTINAYVAKRLKDGERDGEPQTRMAD